MRRRISWSRAVKTTVREDFFTPQPVSVTVPILGDVIPIVEMIKYIRVIGWLPYMLNLRLNDIPTPIKLPPVVTKPIAFTYGAGLLVIGEGTSILLGGFDSSPQWGKPGELVHDIYPLMSELGEPGEMMYFILVLGRITKSLYWDLPRECFTSISNYKFKILNQNDKFKPLYSDRGFFGREFDMAKCALPVLFFTMGTGSLVALPLVSFLLSLGYDFSSYAVDTTAELDATHTLRRVLNSVGHARVPENIRDELHTTMLSVVESGDNSAALQKYIMTIFYAKKHHEVNDNLALDMAREVATDAGDSDLPDNLIAAGPALAQAATQHRGNVRAYIAEAANALTTNGVNYTRHNEADTRKFAGITEQRKAANERSR